MLPNAAISCPTVNVGPRPASRNVALTDGLPPEYGTTSFGGKSLRLTANGNGAVRGALAVPTVWSPNVSELSDRGGWLSNVGAPTAGDVPRGVVTVIGTAP